MIYTADYLITKRKEKWLLDRDIEKDKELRLSIANEIIRNESLRKEIIKYPEKLIELVFVVVDKSQKTLPFFLNDVQKEFINTLNNAKEKFEKGLITEISLLVLKGRQQGFTTLITAYQYACSISNKNFQGFTLADKSDNSEAIFQNKAKFIHSQLPEVLKPSEKLNNRKQLLFDKINSSWAVDTATKDVGRSRTINFFHGSECAFWQCGISPIQAGLAEAFTKNCIKIYESTANGFNDYQTMWDSKNHINCFFAWWKTKEYSLFFESEEKEKEFLNNINTKSEWIYTRLKWLKEEKQLNNNQLYWYYKKYCSYIDKTTLQQEYPCDADEAFKLSGVPVFDRELIIKRLQKIRKPLKTGYFVYKYDDTKPARQKISEIKWINDRNGYIKIYQLPNTPEITKYCIGGDTAGEGSDYYIGQVINAKTGEPVAVLRKQHLDPDKYTHQMYCLGAYYKWALLGIEANFDTYPNMELERLEYPNIYIRTAQDSYSGKFEKRYGFKTTQITRPLIISNLIQIVRDLIDYFNDEDTLRELLSIVKNDKGRIEAPEGKHDDLMMALAIAYYIREQVIFEREEIRVNPTYQFTFESKESNVGEMGEKIEII